MSCTIPSYYWGPLALGTAARTQLSILQRDEKKCLIAVVPASNHQSSPVTYSHRQCLVVLTFTHRNFKDSGF